jgi:hypothetical protein
MRDAVISVELACRVQPLGKIAHRTNTSSLHCIHEPTARALLVLNSLVTGASYDAKSIAFKGSCMPGGLVYNGRSSGTSRAAAAAGAAW